MKGLAFCVWYQKTFDCTINSSLMWSKKSQTNTDLWSVEKKNRKQVTINMPTSDIGCRRRAEKSGWIPSRHEMDWATLPSHEPRNLYREILPPSPRQPDRHHEWEGSPKRDHAHARGSLTYISLAVFLPFPQPRSDQQRFRWRCLEKACPRLS